MNKLIKFLDRLNMLNCMSQCNWQQKRTSAGRIIYIEHYTIKNRLTGNSRDVIFQVYNDNKGFSMYVEDVINDMDKSIQQLIKQID